MKKRLTLIRLAAHDFHRSLRVWKAIGQPDQLFTSLVSQRGKVLALGIRNFLFAVVGTLWLSANKADLTVKLALFDLSIPKSYVNFAVAMSIFATGTNALSYFVLNEFVRIASNSMFKFDSAWVLTLPQDGSNAWSVAWVPQFRFLTSGAAHRWVARATLFITNLPFLCIAAVLYWTVFSAGYQVIRADGLVSSGGAFTVIAWLLVLCPIALAVLIRSRFPFEKNTRFIRWRFLAPLYRRSGHWPPRVNFWIDPGPPPPPR